MRQCSNPTCPHQVEDDARFCGMCGTYVGPEMTSNTTLADVSTQVEDRIQQCRDLISSIQSEPDEKEKAQKIRTVMDIFTSIHTNQLPSKPIANAAEQIQVLSIVVQEMLTLSSISPTASAADIQHWPISPFEMRQWTEILIALNGSNKFSSLDKATKSAVRDALGRFISFVGINARSNPDAEHFLLDLYESIIALSAPELQSCFLGINKSKLFRRLGQRMQIALSGTTPNVSPDDVRNFVVLAAEGLSEWDLPKTEERNRAEALLATLGQVARLGETQPSLATATADAYALLLQMDVENEHIRRPDAVLRLRAVEELNRTARMMAVTHQQSVPSEVMSVLGDNLLELIGNKNLSAERRVAAGHTYVELLGAIVSREKDRREEITHLLGQFSMNCRSTLNMLDPDRRVASEADKLSSRLKNR